MDSPLDVSVQWWDSQITVCLAFIARPIHSLIILARLCAQPSCIQITFSLSLQFSYLSGTPRVPPASQQVLSSFALHAFILRSTYWWSPTTAASSTRSASPYDVHGGTRAYHVSRLRTTTPMSPKSTAIPPMQCD